MTIRLLPAAALLLALAATPAAALGAGTLAESLLAALPREGAFLPLAPAEETRLETLFQQVLAGTVDHGAWREAGFLPTAPAEGIIALQEAENRGRGFHLLRPDASSHLFLHMPHRFADRHTGEIGARLFHLTTARGASWNSRHRRDPQAVSGAASDLAHIPASPFTAQARAAVRAVPAAIILQVHGFASDKRPTPQGKTAAIIVSSGTRAPSRAARDLVQCLEKNGFDGVRLFPRDVEELGGTTNVTGKTLRAMGSDGFVHMEISNTLRAALLKDAPLLERMAACLSAL